MTINDRFAEVINYLIKERIVRNQQEFTEKLNSDKATISLVKNGKQDFPNNMFGKINKAFPTISIDWLKDGKGNMIKMPQLPKNYYGGSDQDNNLIPFYDDVITVGGNKEAANVEGISAPADYIDTGDWFRDATAAIRHYGESMDEYPTGCILAIKEVKDRELVIPGRDYCIETSEYRVTKRLQRGKDKEYITAYSTNPETYADGRLVHEPFDIPWRAITRISLVLGYVVKKNGGTIVFSNNKK